MTILKEDNRIKVVKDGDVVCKRYKNLSKEANLSLLGKLEMSEELSIVDGLVTPFDYQVVNGQVKEIYTKFVKYPDLFYDFYSPPISFEKITKCLTNLNKTLRCAHQKGVVFLDFITKGNLKYNPETFEVYVLDYEDCQIGKYKAFAYSSVLRYSSVIHNKKYLVDNVFTKDTDLYLLVLTWFRMCTCLGLELTRKKPLDLLENSGMSDSEMLRKILLCYDVKRENEYYDFDFTRVYDEFCLSRSSYDGCRKFVKK